MFICCECCVLSGRGLCDEPITRPEESYQMWYVVVCDLETSRMRRPWPTGGCCAKLKKKIYSLALFRSLWCFRIISRFIYLFCVRIITRPEESYRVWCVWVWSWSLENEEALAHWGLLRHGKKNLSGDLQKYLRITYWLCTRECFSGLKLPGPEADRPSARRTIVRISGAQNPVRWNF